MTAHTKLPFTPRIGLIILTDLCIICVSLLNLPELLHRPAMPFTPIQQDERLVIGSVSANMRADLTEGETLLSWNHRPLRSLTQLQYELARSGSGDEVILTTHNGTGEQTVRILLQPAHGWFYLGALAAIGCLSWLVAVFLLVKRPDDPVVRIAHWGLVGLSAVVLVAWEGGNGAGVLSAMASVLFFVAYTVSTASFVLFVSLFPRPRWPSSRTHRLFIVIPPMTWSLITAWFHHQTFVHGDLGAFPLYKTWIEVFRIIHWIGLAIGLGILIMGYVNAREPDEQKKAQWLLWGCIVGLSPFLFLTVLPDLLTLQWSVPEELTILFLALIPLSICVAVIRHHLFDIRLVIRRTTVYGLVIAAILSFYALAVAILTGVFTYPAYVTSAGAALLTALLYEPLRRLVYRTVDQRLFRVQYDFRVAEREFFERIRVAPDASSLARTIVTETTRIIPVGKIAFMVLEQPDSRLRMLAHQDFPLLENRHIPFETHHLRTDLRMPVALNGSIEPGVPFELADESVFSRWGICLVSPVLGTDLRPVAFLVLGPKKAGTRFSAEDIHLLTNVSIEIGVALEKLTAQRELVLQHEETRRLEELNQLKTDFISYVSHEFRTPLTSIRVFTELLDTHDPPPEQKKKEYIGVILSEVDRIERMVHNVLTSARLDHHSLVLSLTPVDLVTVIRRCVERMSFRLEQEAVTVTTSFPDAPVMVKGNAEALGHAMANLLDNAVRYSDGRKVIHVSVSSDAASAEASVRDSGMGIPPDSLPLLFRKFYRVEHDRGGTGLGLSLVKHIADAHHGSVHVESKVGQGSTFSLRIPLALENP